jgi:hypothetical protein
LKQRRTFWSCSHSSTITTIIAGIAREVCENCSHVSVSYVEPAVRPDADVEVREMDIGAEPEPTPSDLEEAKVFEAIITFEASSRILRCGVCTQAAMFTIPAGLRCDEHAWQAASRIDWDDADPWVPIRIYRSNA